MLSKTVEDALNRQMNAEMYSSYLYLSMSGYFAGRSMNGLASWMKQQADEEWAHGMKFFNFLLDRGGNPVLKAIDEPPAEFGSPAECFEQVLAHERKVTGMIHDLVNLAEAEKDIASGPFLNWFVDEQVEEEKIASEILDQLRMVGDNPAAQFMMDQMLGGRSSEPGTGEA